MLVAHEEHLNIKSLPTLESLGSHYPRRRKGSNAMPILNYTTKIDADKSASEIAKCLSLHGAKAVMTEYDAKESYVTSLSFKMSLGGNEIGFRLPCDWKPVLVILENDRKVPRSMVTREQAVKVAWRIVKDWVEAQMALVETKMVTTQEVFLPYAIMRNGKTLAQSVAENPKFLLGDGNK